MHSRLASLMTVSSIAITLGLGNWILVGPLWAAMFGLVSLLSLLAWRGISWQAPDPGNAVMGPYLLVVVSVVVLAACRYQGGFPGWLMQAHPAGFVGHAAVPGDVTWFVAMVVLPEALLLFGAYLLATGQAAGRFMAWWAGLYAIADALLQLDTEFVGAQSHAILYLLGALLALAQLALGMLVCQRLLHGSRVAPPLPPKPMSLRRRNLWTLMFVCLFAVYGATLYTQAGLLPMAVIIGSMMGGLVGWRKTTAKRPADPLKLLPMYLLLLTLFYVHVGEEALTAFNHGIAAITGVAWNDHDFTLVIGLLGPVAWFFAAWSLWRGQAFGNFVLWFLIVGMILGEPTHLLVFPVVAMHKFGIPYGYFSGMYTALFPMIPAIVALTTLVHEHRAAQRKVAAVTV